MSCARRYARFLRLTPDDQEDCVTEAWYLWKRASRPMPVGSFARLAAIRIRCNELYGMRAGRRVDAIHHASSGLPFNPAGRELSPLAMAIASETWKSFLDFLTSRQRRIFHWRMQGMQKQQIAERLEVSNATVTQELTAMRVAWLEANR